MEIGLNNSATATSHVEPVINVSREFAESIRTESSIISTKSNLVSNSLESAESATYLENLLVLSDKHHSCTKKNDYSSAENVCNVYQNRENKKINTNNNHNSNGNDNVTNKITTEALLQSRSGAIAKNKDFKPPNTDVRLALVSFSGDNSSVSSTEKSGTKLSGVHKTREDDDKQSAKKLIKLHKHKASSSDSSLQQFFSNIENIQLAEPIRAFMQSFRNQQMEPQQDLQKKQQQQQQQQRQQHLAAASFIDNAVIQSSVAVVSQDSLSMILSQQQQSEVSPADASFSSPINSSQVNNRDTMYAGDIKKTPNPRNPHNKTIMCLKRSLSTSDAGCARKNNIKMADMAAVLPTVTTDSTNNNYNPIMTISGARPTAYTSNNKSSSNNHIEFNTKRFKIPSDVLDDLASRFIINVPDMELSNLIRICFQIELAHWFYLDFFCAMEDEELKLQSCGMKQFTIQIFKHIPFLTHHLSNVDKILEDWKNYKLSVPTYGAILISEDLDHCLLVQSYFARSSWGFPKGKVNETEDPVHCAAREVYEETGYDITGLIEPKDYIQAVINYQYTRLYIVCNVPLETQFVPQTRNEIKCCDWFRIDTLPINKNDAISKAKLGINANSFFMIMPFIKRLKRWINTKKSMLIANKTTAETVVGEGVAGGGDVHISSSSPKTLNVNKNYNKDEAAKLKRQRHKSMGDLDGFKILPSLPAVNSKNNYVVECDGSQRSIVSNNTNKNNSIHSSNNSSKNYATSNRLTRTKSQSDKVCVRQQEKQQQQNDRNNRNTEKLSNNYVEKHSRNKNLQYRSTPQHQRHSSIDYQNNQNASGDPSSGGDDQSVAAKLGIETNVLTTPINKARQATISTSGGGSHTMTTTAVSNSSTLTLTPPLPALSDLISCQKPNKKRNTKKPTATLDLATGPLYEDDVIVNESNLHLEGMCQPQQNAVKQDYSFHQPESFTQIKSEPNVECTIFADDQGSLNTLSERQTKVMQSQKQQQQQQQPMLERHVKQEAMMNQTDTFTPTIASWINFTFTKNFISNVFF